MYVRKKSNSRGLGNFFLPKPNHTYPPQKSNGRLLTFPCAGEKAHMLFHDNNSFPEDQKTSSAQQKIGKKTYQKCTVKLIKIWCFTENKQFLLEIYWKCEVLLECWKSVQLCSKRKIGLFSLGNNTQTLLSAIGDTLIEKLSQSFRLKWVVGNQGTVHSADFWYVNNSA